MTCSATIGDRRLSKTVSISLARNPVIDAAPTMIRFMTETAETIQVRVWVKDGGAGPWSFLAEWRDGSKPLAKVQKTSEEPLMTTFTLTEASKGMLDPDRYEEASILRLTGTAQGYDALVTDIKVIVTQEGLFIDPLGRDHTDDTFHVDAEGSGRPTEIDFRVYVRDDDGAVRLDGGLAQNLRFTPTDEPRSRSRNGAEVAELTIGFAGARGIDPTSAIYRAEVKSSIPGDVPVLPVRFNVSVPGQTDEAKFTKPLTLGLVPSRDAPGGPDWQLEYDRCNKIIDDYVPLKWHGDLTRILERRGRHLGADGLYALRHQIWVIAQNLTLGEGGMGYHDEAKWANRITTVLEYAEWAGDLAFQAATTYFVGPWAALGIAQAKQLVVSAIVAYEEGLTPEDWLWQNFGAIPAMLEGQVVDIDKFSKLTKDNKIKAWALFVAYHFFKNYLYDDKSFTDSLIEAGRAARDEAIAAWLGQKLKEGPKPTSKSTTTKAPQKLTPKQVKDRTAAWEKGKAEGQRKVDALEQAIKSGDPEKTRQAALDVQADKQAIYAINRGDRTDATKQAMNAHMQSIYGQTDESTIARLAEKYGIPESDFQVLNPTNPKTKVSVGADRDVTIRMKAKPGDWVPSAKAEGGRRQVQEGEAVYVDVPARELKRIYNDEFYKAAGGEKTGMTPDEFAKHMDQVATDRLHAEAYGRYADDLNTAIKKPGRDFTDSEQVGKAMGYKGHEWFNEAEKIRAADPERAEAYVAEGMRQTTKQFRNQVKKRADALNARLKRNNPPQPEDGDMKDPVKIDSKLSKAIDEMQKVESGEKSPAQVQAALAEMGWTPTDVATEIGKQVEMMQKLKPTR